MIDIWEVCNGIQHIKELSETAWRIEGSEEKTITRKLVDSLEEQKILDQLIESTIPKSYLQFHPLIYKPLRNPPLKHGSRFGKKTESGIWYGSLTINTAIIEKAYYQLLFFSGSKAEYDVSLGYTIFSVKLKTSKAIKLHQEPFLSYTDQISSPVNYQESQLLGFKMRNNNVDVFTYHSARDPKKGINIGLYNTNPFLGKNPNNDSFQTWKCYATNNKVEFVRLNSLEEYQLSFSKKDFFIDGVMPSPAV